MKATDERGPQTPAEIIEAAAEAVRLRLPPGWEVRLVDDVEEIQPDLFGDAAIRIVAPTGEASTLPIEAKRSVEARDVGLLEQRLQRSTGVREGETSRMVAARYLNPRVRERLTAAEIGYADATGNLSLALSQPALFLRDAGAQRDPWRGPGRPRDSFRGPIAARVVRALVDFAPPMTVPELIERSEVSTGACYRVVDFLAREALLERQPRGAITRVDWRATLERWTKDYELDLEGAALRRLEPRGIDALLRKLRTRPQARRYALSGSPAARFFEEYAEARMALLYADNPESLADELDLRPVETGANVLLMRPADDVVFARTEERDGLHITAPSQIAADLLNGPGRAPAEAVALLDWMERNESIWRR
jgi:hypothetical protein